MEPDIIDITGIFVYSINTKYNILLACDIISILYTTLVHFNIRKMLKDLRSCTKCYVFLTGGNITISGEKFTVNTGAVFLGMEQANILSWTDTQIEIELLNISAPGSLELKVDVSGDGYAING